MYTWNKGIRNFDIRSKRFSKQPWAQGVILLACVMIAMLLANLPFTKVFYNDFLHTAFTLHIASPDGALNLYVPKDLTVEKLINDVLMMVFFFTVGLEIRREIAYGELSSPRKALLPVIAAFGGVVAPALIYSLVNHGAAAASGWGIPTATDIAFAVCILSVLGDRVPISLKVFLTALAIADDLIAILVVAFFYGGAIRLNLLLIAILVMAFIFLLKQLGEKHVFPYLLLALVVWVLFYYSGIHATMSGVVMAFLIPSSPRYNKSQFEHRWLKYTRRFNEFADVPSNAFPNGPQRHCLKKLGKIGKGSMDMTYRLETALSPWVNFLIMPLFALANAGVEIADPSYFNVFHYEPVLGSVSMGVFLGLVLGKPIGITLFSWIAIKCKVGEMPAKATWPMFFAVACLGGIGFTMSIFVDTLSFSDLLDAHQLRDMGKIAVLMGSLCAGALGSILVSIIAKKSEVHKK
ncbi:MAG: Na+/H+ antiporter NhaA [Bacteroidales bacterium]|nr:Na+/H+ antiporter NhaA [Bacteroidales bacterium]